MSRKISKSKNYGRMPTAGVDMTDAHWHKVATRLERVNSHFLGINKQIKHAMKNNWVSWLKESLKFGRCMVLLFKFKVSTWYSYYILSLSFLFYCLFCFCFAAISNNCKVSWFVIYNPKVLSVIINVSFFLFAACDGQSLCSVLPSAFEACTKPK